MVSSQGCVWKSKTATLPAFCAMDTHDLHRRHTCRKHVSKVYCACHEIMARTKCCSGHAASSLIKFKFQNMLPFSRVELRPQTIASMCKFTAPCHVTRNPSNHTRLPTFWQRSTKHCAGHGFREVPDSLHLPCNLTFRTSTCDGSLAHAMQTCPKTYTNTR